MGLSRNENILENILGANNELGEPQSRIEALLMELLEAIQGGQLGPALYLKAVAIADGKTTFTDQDGNTTVLNLGNGSGNSIKVAGAGQTTTSYGVNLSVSGQVTGQYGSTFGYRCKAGSSGHQAAVAGGNSVSSQNGPAGKTAFGSFNDDKADTIFEVGIGTADNDRDNAVEVDAATGVFKAAKGLKVGEDEYVATTVTIGGTEYQILAKSTANRGGAKGKAVPSGIITPEEPEEEKKGEGADRK